MTEKEWLECTDPGLMVRSLRGSASDRKFRLVACACCRVVWGLLSKSSRRAVETAELLADGLVDEDMVSRVVRAAIEAACVPSSGAFANAADMAYKSVLNDGWYAVEWTVCYGPDGQRELAIIRDIFGPLPFRSIPLNPDWLSWNDQTVPRLAQAIYDERAFDRMPILGDALEDAGCSYPDMLDHCRSGGEHVRGCWVVDIVLGKE